MNLGDELERIGERYGPRITAALQQEATSSGLKKQSGRLLRGFKHQVTQDKVGSWALSFSLPRYAYILNAGIKAGKSVKSPRGNGTYQHPGLPARGFIQSALDRHISDMQDELTQAIGSATDAVIRF